MMAPASSLVAAANRKRLAEEEMWVFALGLPILFWHQTEEWVWPGGFLPWINREVLGSSAEEFPLTRRVGFWVNVGFGWGLGTATLVYGRERTEIAAAFLASNLGNAVFHIVTSARARGWRPGVVTSLLMLAPHGAVGLARLSATPGTNLRGLPAGGAVGGVGAGAGIFAAMRLRLAQARRFR